MEWQNDNETVEEKLKSAKEVSLMGFVGLFVAVSFSAVIYTLRGVLSAFIPGRLPDIFLVAVYFLLWYALCAMLHRKFNKTESDAIITHGVLVCASYNIALIFVLKGNGEMAWLAIVPFVLAIWLSIFER